MKYKVLLIGRNKVFMEDCFQYLAEDFEMQTSSMRKLDITSHIQYYKPDALIYCMNREERERMDIVSSVREALVNSHITLILTGNLDECEEFQRVSGGIANLILKKPITARSLKDKVVEFLDAKKAEEKEIEEAVKAAEEARAAEAAAKLAAESQAAEAAKLVAEAQATEGTNAAEEALRFAAEMKAAEEARMAAAMMAAGAQNSVDAAIKAASQGQAPAQDAKKHILVIDDDPMMLKLIKEQLKDNYSVATAISGAIGRKFLENKKTDMIILDYEMPGESGVEVLTKIRQNPAMTKLPVVFLTGIKDREKIRKVVELKPQGYLLKPIESEQLIKTIRNLIG